MVWIVISFGVAFIGLALAILAKPDVARKMMDWLSTGSRVYLAGAFRLTYGILLLILASQSRWWGFVVGLGLLASAAGLATFFIALKRTKKLIWRLRNQSNPNMRLFAVLAVVIWAALVYALLP